MIAYQNPKTVGDIFMIDETTLKMFTNGSDYIIAESIEEARDIISEQLYGKKYKQISKSLKKEIDNIGWKEKEDNEKFTLYKEDTLGGTTRTVSYWIETEGKGLFASSAY